MIVRINQIDVHHAEQQAGWPGDGPAGPIEYPWPEGTLAFELLILPADEQNQPLARPFRQAQLRQLVPDVIAALQQDDDKRSEQTVVRLDGPLAAGEMVDAFKHLTDARGYGRYCCSPAEKFDDEPLHPTMSLRLHIGGPRLANLCADPNVGLERSVRLRAFSVPGELVNPLLDISDGGDERWDEILSHSSFVLSNTRAMQSLHIITRRFSPDETRARLTQKLVGGVRA
jgi:hypothetical protein